MESRLQQLNMNWSSEIVTAAELPVSAELAAGASLEQAISSTLKWKYFDLEKHLNPDMANPAANPGKLHWYGQLEV